LPNGVTAASITFHEEEGSNYWTVTLTNGEWCDYTGESNETNLTENMRITASDNFPIGVSSNRRSVIKIPTNTSELINDSGYLSSANGNLKVGYNVNAYSQNSIVVGKSSSINSGQCASFGENNTINGLGSIASGINLSVSQNCEYSTVFGTNSVASYNRSFVWNSLANKYFSNGERTFNVNPKDKLSGFYIGTDNFIQCVLSAVHQMNPT
jgi:hypothetical protein